MKQRFDHCEWSRNLPACFVHRCPLKNRKFRDELDKWVLLSRAPRSLYPAPAQGGGYDAEWAMLRKTRIALLFKDEDDKDSSDEKLVLDFIAEGATKQKVYGNMTVKICRALVRGERKYRDMIREERYGV